MTPAATGNDTLRADLILRGLSGRHIAGLLPGGDSVPAIRSIVSGHAGWTGDDRGTWGQVGTRGIGVYASLHDAWDDHSPLRHLPWPEVMAILRRGYGDGRREAYDAALSAFGACCGTGGIGGIGGPAFQRATDQLRATTRAIITAGCSLSLTAAQMDLFGSGEHSGVSVPESNQAPHSVLRGPR